MLIQFRAQRLEIEFYVHIRFAQTNSKGKKLAVNNNNISFELKMNVECGARMYNRLSLSRVIFGLNFVHKWYSAVVNKVLNELILINSIINNNYLLIRSENNQNGAKIRRKNESSTAIVIDWASVRNKIVFENGIPIECCTISDRYCSSKCLIIMIFR